MQDENKPHNYIHPILSPSSPFPHHRNSLSSTTTSKHTLTQLKKSLPLSVPSSPSPLSSSHQSSHQSPSTCQARQHIRDAFRLRLYELEMLPHLSCPACAALPGTLCSWRDGIGAKCADCNAVLEGPRLRDALEPLMSKRVHFSQDVQNRIVNCRREIHVLGRKIENLNTIIAKYKTKNLGVDNRKGADNLQPF